MSIRKAFGEQLKYLYEEDGKKKIKGISKGTLNKYISGTRFPKPEYLEEIKNHYNVSYSYLFREFDNIDLSTSNITEQLGLSYKSIKKMKSIIAKDDIQKKEFMLYALNSLIENIDFEELGTLLLVPNEENIYIESNKIYNYYDKYINNCAHESGNYHFVVQEINKKKEYNDFKLNKLLFKLFERIRNSKKCAETFTNYVDKSWEEIIKVENQIYAEYKDDYDNYINGYYDNNNNPELEKFMEELEIEEHKRIEETNEKIIKEREKYINTKKRKTKKT